MDDWAVVAAVVREDPKGLAAAYDTYADRLHAFCASMLRDRDAAAEALHDTFVVASQRMGQLRDRDRDRLRTWLYAVARNECLCQLRGRQRTTEPDEAALDEAALDKAADVSDGTVEADQGLGEEELRRLVWNAADGLNPRERAALELSVRHGLQGQDLADALGVPRGYLNTLLARARHQLERSLAAILVARTGQRDCPELAGMVADSDGRLTVLTRKRVSRHIEDCETCAATKREQVSATSLLAALPLMGAPFGLRREILGDLGDPQLAAYRKKIARRAGSFTRAGFPVPYEDRRRPPAGSWQWVAAALLFGVFLTGGSLLWHMRTTGGDESAASAASVPPPPVEPSAEPGAEPGAEASPDLLGPVTPTIPAQSPPPILGLPASTKPAGSSAAPRSASESVRTPAATRRPRLSTSPSASPTRTRTPGTSPDRGGNDSTESGLVDVAWQDFPVIR